MLVSAGFSSSCKKHNHDNIEIHYIIEKVQGSRDCFDKRNNIQKIIVLFINFIEMNV